MSNVSNAGAQQELKPLKHHTGPKWERLHEIMVHRPFIRAAVKVQCTDIPHDGARVLNLCAATRGHLPLTVLLLHDISLREEENAEGSSFHTNRKLVLGINLEVKSLGQLRCSERSFVNVMNVSFLTF